MLDDISEHVADAFSKNPICDCSRCNQMPLTDQILVLTCAAISATSSYLSTMEQSDYENLNYGEYYQI